MLIRGTDTDSRLTVGFRDVYRYRTTWLGEVASSLSFTAFREVPAPPLRGAVHTAKGRPLPYGLGRS